MEASMRILPDLKNTRDLLSAVGIYGRFEQVVSLILTLLISFVIVVAVGHLLLRIVALVMLNEIDPANQKVFQSVFGMIMTVLIALEFNHSVLRMLDRRHSIVQVRTVILIALLALVRKLILLDVTQTEPIAVAGLAFAALSLGAVYWLVRDQDQREEDRRLGISAKADNVVD
jgi:uncharacterized membrane protein (DUF373 family)